MAAEEEQKQGPPAIDQAKGIASEEIKGRATDKVTKKVVQKVATKAAGKAATGAAVGTAVGGPIGTVVGFVAGELASKAVTFLNKNKHIVAPIGLVAGGLVLAPVVPILGAGIIGIGVLSGLGATAGVTAGIVSAFLAGLGVIGSAFAGAAGLTFLGVATLTIFSLLVINNSALIVPPSFSTTGPGGNIGGNLPLGCPSPIWPVDTTRGQRYYVNQGPGGTSTHGPPARDFSGNTIPANEALDIHPDSASLNDKLVIATHPGQVAVAAVDDWGGNFVAIRESCGGGGFISEYVHMSAVSVQPGQQVVPGDILGVIGCTGRCSSPHVHYDFRNQDFSLKQRSIHPPPYMTTPFIPVTVPFGCVGRANCGVEI